jgi:AbrB family looped-hinge helix DNA binding protein
MKEFVMVVTRKGQITIPAEVRKRLGVGVGDRVAVTLEEGQARLTRASGAVARTAGMLKSDQASLSAEQMRSAGESAIADATIERSRD